MIVSEVGRVTCLSSVPFVKTTGGRRAWKNRWAFVSLDSRNSNNLALEEAPRGHFGLLPGHSVYSADIVWYLALASLQFRVFVVQNAQRSAA